MSRSIALKACYDLGQLHCPYHLQPCNNSRMMPSPAVIRIFIALLFLVVVGAIDIERGITEKYHRAIHYTRPHYLYVSKAVLAMAGENKDSNVLSELTDGAGDSELERNTSQVNEKWLLRKLDARLLPAVGILYLLSFLDRSNGKS